jgi:hypothetical protein
MKATIALVSAALAATACTRVIERDRPVPTAVAPSVVTTERVVERPAPTPPAPSAASGSTMASCIWNGQPTSHGGMSCQEHAQHRCVNGTWERTVLSC